METTTLSPAALGLLREYRGDIAVDESNRHACWELAAIGFLVDGHSFRDGREAFYRMTAMGVKFVDVLARIEASFVGDAVRPVCRSAASDGSGRTASPTKN